MPIYAGADPRRRGRSGRHHRPRRLTAAARGQISAAEAVYVSAASIWEIAIKAALRKIDDDVGVLADAIEASGFLELPVSARHAVALANLPAHPTDPFDRLLIAQAFSEPLHFLTADRALTAYGGAISIV